MKVKDKLLNKVNRHLRFAGVPKWIHHFGPKKILTAQLVLGLAVRETYRLTYRKVSVFLDEYYAIKVHWTTLQKAANRLPLTLWQNLLRLTSTDFSMLAAIDSTGFSTTNPSFHYLHRIDGKMPRVPVKLSIMIDVDSRKVLSARVRKKPVHDTRDVTSLLRQTRTRPLSIVMDKAYDSEPLHEWLDTKGVWSISPTRKGCRHGKHRKKLRDNFPEHEYAYRNIVESVFRSLKAHFSGYIRSRKARTIRAEMFMRLIMYNMISQLNRLFLQPPAL